MTFLQATNTAARVIPRVDSAICLSCARCTARQACRTKALLQIDPGEPPFVDPSLCYGCHQCLPACPAGAIVLPGASLE
ncbi:MAG: 4Fe-4S binding protein [Chloroflexia bacterium]|nr:4Fe-4S binding protein [Chloroflexia bacterium]